MATFSSRTRVSELQRGPAALMETLLSTGLFRDGDDADVMLGELCWSFGFNPGILLTMLESARVEDDQAPLDPAPFLKMRLSDLVEHIEQVHHVYLRDSLPRLTAMTAAVAAARAGDEQLAELHEEMRHLAVELDAHLAHEEEALFPMVRNLDAQVAVTPTRCGNSVGGPIACMENDHDTAARSLRRMRELTGDYATPAGADPAWKTLLEGLAEFDRDLREHMFKENKVLFPRALDVQNRSYRRGSPV